MRRFLLAPESWAVALPHWRLRVGIMAEQAESIGARLELSSSDDGTCVAPSGARRRPLPI